MNIFDNTNFDNHEQVSFFSDKETGLRCIIAVHNTNMGPALGGTRMWQYDNDEDAITDALRLSKGMTYKNALAGLSLGGGKAVLIGDSKTMKTKEYLHAYARAVNAMGGMYLTAEDIGMTVQDMSIMREVTEYAHGLPDQAGNPAPCTAYGTYVGIKAAVKHRLGKDSLDGVRVAIQGLGSVGMNLGQYLHDDGAVLVVTDINEGAIIEAKTRWKGTVDVDPSMIHYSSADVYAPCAFGGVINDETVQFMAAKIVAGCANNQLLTEDMGQKLKEKDILYAPDYVINAGGVIDVAHETSDGTYEHVMDEVSKIYDTLTTIFERADKENLPTNIVANTMAEEIFKKDVDTSA